MTRRLILTLLLGIGITAGSASAGTVSYDISLTTPDFGSTGWIDFSFNPVNGLTSLPATATITNFQQSGYTLDSTTQTSPDGITGDLTTPPLMIPNVDTANFFTQHVLVWGNSFAFTVTLSGDAIGTPAADGSTFRLTLYDEDFGSLASPLPDGVVASIDINPDGTTNATANIFDGGIATVTPVDSVPEPGTAVLSIAALAGIYLRRRRH